MRKEETKFVLNKQKFHAYPNLDQLLEEAGIANATSVKKILTIFDSHGIFDVSQLFSYSIKDLIAIGLSKKFSLKITQHMQILRRRTNLILSSNEIKEYFDTFDYLTTGNGLFDNLLTYANGETGLRSRTLVEIYGSAGIGKTQVLMSLAVMCIRPTPGWSRIVYFIDTEGSFDIYRFQQIASLHGVDKKVVDKHLRVARAYNFDEVEQILTEIAINARNEDIGMILIDSIIDPLKSQYPLDDDLSNLQERQQHLKIVTDQLKSIAQIHNCIAVISNQVRSSFNSETENKIVPQGGNILAHATDLRFYLRECKTPQIPKNYSHELLSKHSMQLVSIELVDCGFLSPGIADIIIGKMGAADPRYWKIFTSDNTPTVVGENSIIEQLYD